MPTKPFKFASIGQILDIMNVEYKTEYHFHPTRKWRFDYAIVDKMIAIEYEGLYKAKSRHTTISGFKGDIDKYNEATYLGWKVYRVTNDHLIGRNGFEFLEKILN